MIGWRGHVERMRDKTSTYRVFVGKPEGNRTLGRLRHRLEDSIKIDLRKNGWGDLDWIFLDQGRGQWRALVNLRV
jgi:hypothetical protein